LVKRVQTPQCFQLTDLKKAYQQEYNSKFTDDASVAESMGMKINLVEGNPENIKITTPFDLKLAEFLVE
jgi:2-C-methyl-D-erythritol 4-phosphate cytidylyltransferase